MSELPLRLTWDGRRPGAGDSSLALGFLPGRTEVRDVLRREPGAGPDGSPGRNAPRRLTAEDCWLIPLSAAEHTAGELRLLVRYRHAPPVVAGLRLVGPKQLAQALVELGKGIVSRTNARCQNRRGLTPSLVAAFDWFSSLEMRSNDRLLERGGGARLDEDPTEVMRLIGECRAELMSRLHSRAEFVLVRRLLPGFCRSPDFAELSHQPLAPALSAGPADDLWRQCLGALGQTVSSGLRVKHASLDEARRLLQVRDRILDSAGAAGAAVAADGAAATGPELSDDPRWGGHEVAELGRRFRLFARGRLRVDDDLHELNAEPNSSYFFLFGELAVSLGELPVPDDTAGGPGDAAALITKEERLRWREIARELVICEHLFRRTYVPGPSLLVHDFSSYGRANMDRDPRRGTTAAELEALERLYSGLSLDEDDGWRVIVDDHALLVTLACPGWLTPWADLAKRLEAGLREVTVAADGLRGADHTVRLFVRHMISGFAELPHDTLDGQLPMASLGLTGDSLERLTDSLRGYVLHRSHGTQELRAGELEGLTVGEVLRRVVARCRLRIDGETGDLEAVPCEGVEGGASA